MVVARAFVSARAYASTRKMLRLRNKFSEKMCKRNQKQECHRRKGASRMSRKSAKTIDMLTYVNTHTHVF